MRTRQPFWYNGFTIKHCTSRKETSPHGKIIPDLLPEKSFFNSAAKSKETKISINNSKIQAPPVVSSAPAASIIKRTQIEGVDGSFVDAKLNETVKNHGGKTYKFMTCWPGEYQGGKNATQDAQRCADAIKSIENDYNCKIKIVAMPGDALKGITSARTAGTVYADIFDYLANGLPIFTCGNGADLMEVKSVDVKANRWNPLETLVSSYKSQVFGVAVRYDWSEQDILFFNKRLAQKYNLGNFYDMVNKGQWTDNIFLQVSQRFKKVAPSNIFACEAMYPTHLLNLVYTNWSSPFGITENKYIFNGTDSSVLDILSYLQTYIKSGLFDTYYNKSDLKTDGTFQCDISDYSHASTAFQNGNSLFFFGSNGDAVLPYLVKSSKDDYGLLPLPKGPAADSYSTVISNVRFLSLFNDPDVENSGSLLTAIANRTNIKTADIISHNTTLVRDQQSIETLTNNYKYKQILNVELSSAGNLPYIYYGAAIPSVFKQQATPKQAMESIAKKAQTEIDKAFGQK